MASCWAKYNGVETSCLKLIMIHRKKPSIPLRYAQDDEDYYLYYQHKKIKAKIFFRIFFEYIVNKSEM